MSYVRIAVFVLACVYAAELKPQPAEFDSVGHYWREYEGYVPNDALQVGQNMYIGQVFANGIRQPANINGLKKYAEYLYNGRVYTTKDYVKILCSTDPAQFEWVKTDTSGIMRLLPTRNIIVGGQSENDKPLLIGRSHDNHLVGMVTIYSDNDGLHYPLNGQAADAEEFDVYAYKKVKL